MADSTSSPFTFGDCPTCRGHNAIYGLDCAACGHHFHIGRLRLAGSYLACPRCEATAHPVEIGGEAPVQPQPATEEETIDIICGEVEPAVARRIRRVAASRRSRDPQYWANVMLRESWYVEHGSYDGWDEAARVGGQDPTMYGPA